MPRITFLAADGCLFSGIAGLIDALSIANLWYQSMRRKGCGGLFDTEIVSIDGRAIQAYGGIEARRD